MRLHPNDMNREDGLALSNLWKLWFTPIRVLYPPLPPSRWFICLWSYLRPPPQLVRHILFLLTHSSAHPILLTPPMDSASCRNFTVHTFSARPTAFLGSFNATMMYMSFLIRIFLSSNFISAHFQILTIYIHLLLGGYWLSSCSLSRI